MRREQYLKALEEERAGYLRDGKHDRVRDVEEAMRAAGHPEFFNPEPLKASPMRTVHQFETTEAEAVETAARVTPRKRR